MTSILFKKAGKGPEHSDKECDDLFADLNLDQIIHEILSGKKDLCLEGLFKTPLSDIESIAYRQDALQDMENEKLFADLMRFSREMAESKRQLALESGLRHQEHRDGWFLEAALSYVEAVSTLLDDLSDADLKSDALTEWRRWLTAYAEGVEFKKLAERSKEVEKGLSAAKYTVQIKGNTCSVRKFSGESNHETEIGLTFAKFQEGAVKEYLSAAKFKSSGMNHVKGRILELVAKLHPDEFEALRKFRADFADFLDERISAFDRESQFLLAYLGYISPMREKGLKFCYPEMTTEKGDIGAEEVFDLAFARKLLHKDAEIVVNDFNLKGKKRILVVSGPNQGGKTTFARTFGQTHYLAKLGFPVPGKRAKLFLCDEIFTHFEREETLSNLRGKLLDDLTRAHDILTRASGDSIIILNEIFNSTTLKDGVSLGERILKRISELDCVCLLVTFMEELSRVEFERTDLNGKTVSLVGVVKVENPAERTYKIVMRPADGRAYAKVMAEKHHLTYDEIKERIRK